MNKISVLLDEGLDIKELKKVIGFISQDIVDYQINENELSIYVNDDANCQEIKEAVISLSRDYIPSRNLEKDCYMHEKEILTYFNNFKSIHYFDEGMISLSDQSRFLFYFLEKKIVECVYESFLREDCDIVTKVYPVLLPLKGYKRTGYLKRTPQYSFMCCSLCENLKMLNEINKLSENKYKDFINNPEYTLSPSACFHVYEEHKDKILKKNAIITFTQSVFRNEGRFNFAEFGRMRDYHVREIVFIGDSEFVNESRCKIIDFTKKLIEYVGLRAKITSASDPFIIPRMQKYKKLQVMEKSKYELRVAYSEQEEMSVASFNLHGTAFTHPFNIKVENVEETVTGCVGYGLERFVLSFLSQYGEDISGWPAELQDEYYKKSLD